MRRFYTRGSEAARWTPQSHSAHCARDAGCMPSSADGSG